MRVNEVKAIGEDAWDDASYVDLGVGARGRGAALQEGAAMKPFMLDDGIVRSLHFTADFVQSEMSVEQPDALLLRYTRKMMAFLLFCAQPADLVIVGLGGGSLSKFCFRQLPRTQITTVEIDADVIGWARRFEVPVDDPRMSIVHADATEYFATTAQRFDVILIDGCDAYGTAPAFCNEYFYRQLRARLRPRGVLVVNLVGSAEAVKVHQHFLAAAFERLLVVDVSGEGNRLAFAFGESSRPPDWARIQREAKKLQRRHALDFPAFARKLQRCDARQAMAAKPAGARRRAD